MFKNRSRIFEKTAEVIGFVIAYSLFTIGLFTILSLTKKLPLSWTLLHIVIITFSITLTGFTLRKILK